MSQVSIGAQAPDFDLMSVHDGSRRLSEALKQGPVVLAFYKASCSTCQFTFPFIQEIYAKAGKTAPWTLWAVSQDDHAETLDFVRQNGLTFDVLIDEHPYPVSATYGLHNVPAIFVIDADGKISLSDFGFSKDTLNKIAGFPFFTPEDGLPSSRPG